MSEPNASETTATELPGLARGEQAIIEVRDVAKWYGDIVAVSDMSFGIGAGVTGLLGPNGAGKSTLLNMISGLLAPSAGSVRVLGKPVRGNPAIYRQIGLASEQEHVYGSLQGREFVRLNAILQGVPDADGATERVIRVVGMESAANRRVGGYSKGMRQRIKVAAALVHEPQVLLLDEPLNGTDPVQRASLIDLMRRLGDEGKTVVVSSHVLSEVERFARNVLVVVNGKLAAAGDYRTIRERMDQRDHIIRIRCSDPRRLASSLVADRITRSVRFQGQEGLIAETDDVRRFGLLAPEIARREQIRIFELQATDESLASVFSYLVNS